METVIEINGLPVKFSDQKPTRPGAYWWAWNAADKPQLRTIFNPCSDVLIDLKTDLQPQDVGGLWSAPLVPVTEVEKAWDEGWLNGADAKDGTDPSVTWLASNAIKVVEGVQ